ncbi:MAG TPA: DUF5668 domain-containing protein [Bacteroidota bacterium]|nr:DUF5668 domain-containing protein [Bacteroidota bacterium]
MEYESDHHHRGSLVVGVLLLLVGLAFMLDNFDLIYIGAPIGHFWPLIVVAFGLARIFEADTPRQRRKGFFWVFIGLWLFVSVLHMFGLTFHNSWPLLLIGFGINAVWKAVTPQPEWRTSKG